MDKMSKEELSILQNGVRNELSALAHELGYSVGEGGWRGGLSINTRNGEESKTVAVISFKQSDVYRRGKGFFPTLFVSVKGGYQAGYRDGGRSVTYKVSDPSKLDSVKARIRLAVQATLDGIEYEKELNAERKSTKRTTLKTLKAHGFIAKTFSGEEWDEETDDRILFGNSGQRADGMTVGVDATGEITVRLPKGMTLDEFLSKLD